MRKLKRRQQSSAKSSHGGLRAGSGRRPDDPAVGRPPAPADDDNSGIPWVEIHEAACAGVQEREIITALGLDEQHLRASPAALDKFRGIVARGHAWCRVNLQVEIDERSRRTHRNAGSVNVLALRARNLLGWDRQRRDVATEPDLTTARERLRARLMKLAEQRSQAEWRPVTPAMILAREALGDWPEDDAAARAAVFAPPLIKSATPPAAGTADTRAQTTSKERHK